MSYSEKIGTLELLVDLLTEHENKIDLLLKQIEIIDQTIQKNPRLTKSVKEFDSETIKETSNKNILIVDDDINLSNSFKLILESVGYSVETVYTGLQALDKIDKFHYDLVILDINLPDMMGYEVAEEIKDGKNNTDIVFITGYISLSDNQDKTLMKPIEPEQLIETAEAVIENKLSPPKSAVTESPIK
jgi:CheY-like chemotaxis protein